MLHNKRNQSSYLTFTQPPEIQTYTPYLHHLHHSFLTGHILVNSDFLYLLKRSKRTKNGGQNPPFHMPFLEWVLLKLCTCNLCCLHHICQSRNNFFITSCFQTTIWVDPQLSCRNRFHSNIKKFFYIFSSWNAW